MIHQKTLLWFRRDLRLRDNPALVSAVKRGAVLPLYIHDNSRMGVSREGAASRWWLHHSLAALDKSLGGRLNCFQGDALEIIPRLCEREGIGQVVWNRCYEPWAMDREEQLEKRLLAMGREVESHNASLLWEPWAVLKGDGNPYKVFTPYYRNGCLGAAAPRLPMATPASIDWAKRLPDALDIEALELLDAIPWYQGFDTLWTPGEEGAADQLSDFIRHRLGHYQGQRNIPASEGTSRLSAHLHFGEISPHQVWHACRQQGRDDKNREVYLTELAWREFSAYLLYHFPGLPTKNFNRVFDAFPWRRDGKQLRAWQRGETGIPIVDAGMRQLWQSGYMHNRVRMIVASFLVKNLLIHWREGVQWFADCLVDADLANNSASWQWVAGSGADAAPYFRIFNPVLQGEKFDPRGHYVRQYCPELAAMPDRYIHSPWKAGKQILEEAGIRLGKDYPFPLVDLGESRQRALEAFKTMKSESKQRPR